MSTPGRQVSRQSPRTVETWVVVMLSEWLVLWCPRPWVGRLASPRLLPEGSQGSGVQGTPKACRAQREPGTGQHNSTASGTYRLAFGTAVYFTATGQRGLPIPR